MPGVYHAPYPDTYRFNGSADACAEASLVVHPRTDPVHLIAPDEVAAIVVEPIQGEGGYIVPPKAFLQGLRELTTQHGIMLVLDEVQSGMGRTGKMFASEHFGVKGDIVNIAKGIASGLPLGVTCVARGRDELAARRAREHVRRQSRRLRRRARHDQAAARAVRAATRRPSAST